MSRFSAFISLLLFTVAISMVTASKVPSPNEVSPLDSGAVQMVTDVVEKSAETRAVTPYEYKAVMLQNVPGRKLDCWQCGNPCSFGFCCNDGYPQCCLVNNICRCCRV